MDQCPQPQPLEVTGARHLDRRKALRLEVRPLEQQAKEFQLPLHANADAQRFLAQLGNVILDFENVLAQRLSLGRPGLQRPGHLESVSDLLVDHRQQTPSVHDVEVGLRAVKGRIVDRLRPRKMIGMPGA